MVTHDMFCSMRETMSTRWSVTSESTPITNDTDSTDTEITCVDE